MAMIQPPPLEVLRRFAPGTVLREAARLIFTQGTGALIVIGPEDEVEKLSTGGFRLEQVPVTAQRIDRTGGVGSIVEITSWQLPGIELEIG